MNILIITQVLDPDDPILGFFYDWVVEFSRRFEHVYVVAYSVKAHGLPENVHPHAISPRRRVMGAGRTIHGVGGKSSATRRLINIIYLALKIWSIMVRLHGRYDVVFAHMNPEFAIMAFPMLRLLGGGRRVLALWYLHVAVTWRLKLAARLVDVIFTAHPLGCRVGGGKVVALGGHGIKVPCTALSPCGDEVVFLGRISRSKKLEVLVEAFKRLLQRAALPNLKLTIYGEVLDREYVAWLRRLIKELRLVGKVNFKGPLPHSRLNEAFKDAILLVSPSSTGLDKAPLEAMAHGIPALVSHPYFKDTLSEALPICMFRGIDDLTEKMALLIMDEQLRRHIGAYLRQQVMKIHDLSKLIERIRGELMKVMARKLRVSGVHTCKRGNTF